MESINISFTVTGQDLVGDCPFLCASNTVSYIIANFDLDDNWKEFDSVRAVWHTDSECISTVLDNNGNCNVPQEVLKRKNEVIVNLVGSVVEDNELTERLTTYPVVALIVDATALICGTETAEVTPSQFEQYIAQVIAEVEKVTGMTAVAVPLPEGSDPTASYEDGVLTLGIPKGEKGDTGNGIESVEFNSDYSLTFYFTESEPYTTPSIRGARGAQGYGIVSVEKIGSVGLVDTYQVNYENPEVEPTTFTVTNGAKGETGNGIESAVLNDDYTLTLTFTDGTEYTTPSIRGEQGEPGEVTLAQLSAVLPTDTASGSIASFPDGSDLFDYLSCIVDIEPVQDLHGYDKPWVGGAGSNKWDEVWELGDLNTNTGGDYPATDRIRSKNYVPVVPSATYYNACAKNIGVCFYDANKAFIAPNIVATANTTFTTPSNAYYLRFYVSPSYGTTYNHDIAINYPSTVTTYSPWENLCPITGWTGCEVDVAGVNLFDIDSVTQVHISESETRWGVLIDKAGAYTVKANASNASPAYIYGKVKSADGTYGSNIYIVTGTSTTVRTITINSGEQLAVFNASGSDTESTSKALLSDWKIQIETGSTASDYSAYNGTTYNITWQTEAGTVYGGTVDLVTGVLTVTGAKDTYDQQASIGMDSDLSGYHRFYIANNNIKKHTDYTPHMKANLCPIVNNYAYYGGFDGEMAVTAYSITSNQDNYVYIISKTISSVADLKTFLTNNPLEVWYELAQAQTYQLDPVQVACLLGRNNVWADCGDIEEVKYKADVQLWVEKKLNA